jgi:hypothetical protein
MKLVKTRSLHLFFKLVGIVLFLIGTCPTLNAQWNQLGQTIYGGEAHQAIFATSISYDGNTIAIGTPENNNFSQFSGRVRVYDWNGISWVQRGANLNGVTEEQFGRALSLSEDGNIVAIGALGNSDNGNDAGQVRVYQWNGAAWLQMGNDINGEAAGDIFGWSVRISPDGTVLMAGAPSNNDNGLESGHVRVFDWDGNNWVQRGLDIAGSNATDGSGNSVDVSSKANTIAIGSSANSDNGSLSGHVRVFDWDGTSWIQRGNTMVGEAAGDQSGISISMSLDDRVIAIGAPQNYGTGPFSGHVRVYEWNGTQWVQRGMDINGEAANDISGYSVSLSEDGDLLAIGAPSNGVNQSTGHVRVYKWTGTSWVQSGTDIDGVGVGHNFGQPVSISRDGKTFIASEIGNDSLFVAEGAVRIFRCSEVFGTDTVTACNEYTAPSGLTTYYTSGNYNDTIRSIAGCDSIVSINLTIQPLDVSVTQSGISLTANANGFTYQWIDCNTLLPVSAATGQNFTATLNGSYAVVVNNGNCTDTSDCYDINTVSVEEEWAVNDLAIFPNPNSGIMHLSFSTQKTRKFTIKLIDLTGRQVLGTTILARTGRNELTLNTTSVAAGVYQLVFADEQHHLQFKKVVIK